MNLSIEQSRALKQVVWFGRRMRAQISILEELVRNDDDGETDNTPVMGARVLVLKISDDCLTRQVADGEQRDHLTSNFNPDHLRYKQFFRTIGWMPKETPHFLEPVSFTTERWRTKKNLSSLKRTNKKGSPVVWSRQGFTYGYPTKNQFLPVLLKTVKTRKTYWFLVQNLILKFERKSWKSIGYDPNRMSQEVMIGLPDHHQNYVE
jgi:hypothetical protein